MFPLFAFLGTMPIRLWDESRLAINSFEMLKSGNWLVLTFKGEPDLWNAKPPLMIWLQVLSMKVLGINEWAIRLPSALAALVTCLGIFWFFAVKYKNTLLSLLIIFVLMTCHGYIRIHGVRNGDFDSLLVMFTTLYCLFYFLYIEEDKTKYLYSFICLLIGAALTKGIAGLIFLPALLIYTVLNKRTATVLINRHFYIGIALFLFFVGGYYLLREHYNPGYIAAMVDNEITGRYTSEEGGNRNSEVSFYWWFFTNDSFRDWFKIFFVGAFLGIFSKDFFLRKITIYSLLTSIFYFVVVSAGKCKNEWYDMACYPLFCIVTGVGLFIIIMFLSKAETKRKWLGLLLPVVFITLVSIQSVSNMTEKIIEKYGDINSNINRDITIYLKSVFHEQRENKDYFLTYTGYQADVDWYLVALNDKGNAIRYINKDSLNMGNKVIAYLDEDKNHIENFYNFIRLDTFRTVTVYHINGKK